MILHMVIKITCNANIEVMSNIWYASNVSRPTYIYKYLTMSILLSLACFIQSMLFIDYIYYIVYTFSSTTLQTTRVDLVFTCFYL